MKKWLLFAMAFAAWAGLVAGTLAVVGGIWTACAPDPHMTPAAACSWGVDWIATVILLIVLFGGGRMLTRLAKRIGIPLP